MKEIRFAKLWAMAAGLTLLSAVPELSGAQSVPPAPAQRPPTSLPPRSPGLGDSTDIFAGLKYTDDQRAKIHEIHRDFKAKRDAVIKDKGLTPEQKRAMLQGYQHMERGEVYKILSTEQRTEVRKRVLAGRESVKQEQEKRSSPQ
jgi:hypothetical protein